MNDNFSFDKKTSPKGLLASKCNVGRWIFSKSLVFWGNFLEFFWNFFVFFWNCKSADNKKLFEFGRNSFVCQDFGIMEKTRI